MQMDLPRSPEDGQMFAMRDHPMEVILATVSSLVVVVHFLALMIATCILPFAESAKYQFEAIDADERNTQLNLSANSTSFAERRQAVVKADRGFLKYVQLAWILSTGLGIVLFTFDLPIIAFCKFYTHSPIAAYVACGVLTPAVIVVFIFAVKFYNDLVSNKANKFASEMHHIERLQNRISNDDEDDWVPPKDDMQAFRVLTIRESTEKQPAPDQPNHDAGGESGSNKSLKSFASVRETTVDDHSAVLPVAADDKSELSWHSTTDVFEDSHA